MSFSDLAVAYGEYCSVLNDAVTQAEDDIWVSSWTFNSISKATIYFNVNRMTQSVTSTEPPKVSTPFLPGSEKKGKPSQKVASIWLKIGQRVAYG